MSIDFSLNQLAGAGLIRQAQLEPELEYIFRHALVQDAAYDSLLKADRKKLHAQVADVLEVNFKDRIDELLGIITYHHLQAENWEKTLLYAKRAANLFKQMFANQEALTYYQIALQAAVQLSKNKEVQQQIFDILSERQGVWTLLGQVKNAEADLTQMADIARELKDDRRLADALNGLGYSYINSGAVDPQPILREALEIKRRIGDKPGQADSLNTLGSVLLGNGGIEEAVSMYSEARQIYESMGSEDGIARSEWSIGLAEYELMGNFQKAKAHFENSIAICKKLGMRNLECGCYMMMGANYVRMGNFEESSQAFKKGMNLALQIGDYLAQGWIVLYESWQQREQKDFEKAIESIQRAMGISKEGNVPNLLWYANYSLAQCQILIGQFKEALQYAQQAYDMFRSVTVWSDLRCRASALLAKIHAGLGDEKKAEAYALEAVAEIKQFGSSNIPEIIDVYLTCYHTLQKNSPAQAAELLQRAREKLSTQLAQLANEQDRKQFSENVRMNREFLELWNSTQSGKN